MTKTMIQESGALYQSYATIQEPADIFSQHSELILKRFRFLAKAYQSEIKLLDCSRDIERAIQSEQAKTAFYMIHSSLEHTLHALRNGSIDHESLSHSKWLIRRVLERAIKQSHETQYFTLIKEHGFKDSFPDPACVKRMCPSRLVELWQRALELLDSYQVGLKAEINQFILDVVFDLRDEGSLLGESADYSPGHILIAPARLIANENMKVEIGSEIELYLAASQILHEFRHQKGFFYNRMTDDRVLLRPCGLVPRAQHCDRLADPLQDYCLIDLFDLAMATSSEYFFLKYILETKTLGDYQAAFEAKMNRKRTYMLAACASGEQCYDLLGQAGQETWEAIQRFWGQQ